MLFDPQKLRELVGEDEIEVAYGIVQAVDVHADGLFVSVRIQPRGPTVLARIGLVYAGNGFGFLFPMPKIDEDVVVLIPRGNLQESIILPRIYNLTRRVLPEYVNNPDQVLLVTGNGVPVNIRADKINLNQGTKGAARKDDIVSIDSALLEWISAVQAILTASTGKVVSGAPTVPIPTNAGQIATASESVKIG